MKTFKHFQEDQSKNPFIDQKTGRQNPGVYGHNPPIHKLASGNKYTNDILDREGTKELDQYLQEPEVMKFFRDNDNRIRSTLEGPSGVKTKYYTNKFVVSKKGTLPRG